MTDKKGIRLKETECTLCGRENAQAGAFSLDSQGLTTFTAKSISDLEFPFGNACEKAGAKCADCDPNNYPWLREVPANARQVLQDMVDQHFVDQVLADRYLAGLKSHRFVDPAIYMMPSENRLWLIAQTRVLMDIQEFVTKKETSVEAIAAYLRAYELQMLARTQEADLDQRHAEMDRRLVATAERKDSKT